MKNFSYLLQASLAVTLGIGAISCGKDTPQPLPKARVTGPIAIFKARLQK